MILVITASTDGSVLFSSRCTFWHRECEILANLGFLCTFYRFKYYGLVPKLTNISYDNFSIHKRVTLNNDVDKVAKAEFALRFYIERAESIENINVGT